MPCVLGFGWRATYQPFRQLDPHSMGERLVMQVCVVGRAARADDRARALEEDARLRQFWLRVLFVKDRFVLDVAGRSVMKHMFVSMCLLWVVVVSWVRAMHSSTITVGCVLCDADFAVRVCVCVFVFVLMFDQFSVS